MVTLPKLTQLILFGNPRLGIPTELLGPEPGGPSEKWENSPADILDYLARTTRGGRPLNEAKLIVLGWGGAGKTSIVNRLVHDRFVAGEPAPRASRSPPGPSHSPMPRR